ncbi:AMP-binding enzyme [Cupriavidus necator]
MRQAQRASLTDPEIQQFCRTRLANYKVRGMAQFVDDLPKTVPGKIWRRHLKRSWAIPKRS